MQKVAIGKIVHFFPKVGVAVVRLQASLNVGDTVEIGGKSQPFTQSVSSMQVNHKAVSTGRSGEEVAIKVSGACKEGDLVYKTS